MSCKSQLEATTALPRSLFLQFMRRHRRQSQEYHPRNLKKRRRVNDENLHHRAPREVPHVRSTKSIRSLANTAKSRIRNAIALEVVLDHAIDTIDIINLIEGQSSQRVRFAALNLDQRGIRVHALVVGIVIDVGIKKMKKSFSKF